jgi:hypothetical protein
MQGAAIKLAFANKSRALALLLMLVLVLTPACSSFCQAQACQESNATKQESGCHYQLTTDHSSRISPKAAKCGARDLLFALPESAGEWRAGDRTSASSDPDYSSPSNSAAPAFSFCGVAGSNAGQLSGFHKPVASQISVDSLVVLRI